MGGRGPRPRRSAAWGPALALGLLLLCSAREGAAQEGAPLLLSVVEEDGSLEMRIGTLFEDQELTQALHSGLPLRLQIRVALWKDGFFDSQRGQTDWRASVIYDPLERAYRIATGEGEAAEVSVDSLPAAARALEDAFQPTLRPRERGRFYYMGTGEVQTLSLSDLDELERWLQGDVAPSARDEDEREVGNLVGRGFRRVFVRILGLPSRRFRLGPTPRFEVDPGGS